MFGLDVCILHIPGLIGAIILIELIGIIKAPLCVGKINAGI